MKRKQIAGLARNDRKIFCPLVLFSRYNESMKRIFFSTACALLLASCATTNSGDGMEKKKTVKADKLVALTFDDGPNTTTTKEVLDVLQKHGVVATFFLIGVNINSQSAAQVKRAADMGCEIANHSRTHSNMTSMTEEEIKAEFDYVDDKVFEITGKRTAFFRPPYIAVNETMTSAIDAPFICGIGANDWDSSVSVEQRVDAIIGHTVDGTIILLHDAQGNSKTVKAIDTIIPTLKSRGFAFVTMTDLFAQARVSPARGKIYSNVFQSGAW